MNLIADLNIMRNNASLYVTFSEPQIIIHRKPPIYHGI